MCKRFSLLFLIATSFLFSEFAIANETLDKAKQLINEQHSEQAYNLLIDQVEEQAGTPEFDLLLGIAALNSGNPTQAVFALERVLAMQPDNVRARTELARAYYEMGENEAAKEEFTDIKQKSLPSGVNETIEKYLSAIETRFASGRRRTHVYVEAAGGFDSNVNSATDTSTIAIPAFGNLQFTLDRTGREVDSGFFRLGGGASISNQFFDRETYACLPASVDTNASHFPIMILVFPTRLELVFPA